MRLSIFPSALLIVAGIVHSFEVPPERSGLRAGANLIHGKNEYDTFCANCHGYDGKGEGPFSSHLVTKVPDLTVLSAANGGEFPYWRVFAIIDGRYFISGHGSREMPIWGKEFLSGDIVARGPKGGGKLTDARILALASYIATLQSTP